MATAINTMIPVALPRFASATATSAQPANAAMGVPQTSTTTPAWVTEGNAEALDFDLLAEYLLDDTAAAAAGTSTGMPTFDFSVDSAPASGVVSPEQSDDGIAPEKPLPPPLQAPLATPVQPPVAPPQTHAVVAHAPAPVPVARAPIAHAPIARAQISQAPIARAPIAQAPIAQAPVMRVAPAPIQPVPAPAPPMVTRVAQPVAHAPVGLHPAQAPAAPYRATPMPTPVPARMPAQTVIVSHHGLQLPTPGVTVQRVAQMPPSNKRQRIAMPAPHATPMVMAIPGGAIVNGHMVPHPPVLPGRGRQKTQAQIDRRRERNRILARRTRLRKKFFFESLQKDVTDLQRENLALKELVRQHLPQEESKGILEGCKAMEQLPREVQEACGEVLDGMESRDFSLVKSIQKSQHSFVITDPSLQDNPIVYASDDFLSLVGYKREEVLGRNCRFLQGTETSSAKVEQIRKAVSQGEDVSVCMINYTADGSAFWNKLFIAALRDAHNNIVNFIGVIVKVAAPDPDDPEAKKRLPGEVVESPEAGEDEDDDEDPKDATMVEGAVKAIEGAVTAAVAAAPTVPAQPPIAPATSAPAAGQQPS
mmetsp:Transcript_40071/g.59427  ORF Transcript_40071/g.59427 Transcript_40071/m.59427 type:complete len:592 (-) Transcript_40071:929-2704(-)